MTLVLAIDPGPEESAFAFIDGATRRPVCVGKVLNERLLRLLSGDAGAGALLIDTHHAAIEMVASYGMAVGAEVFETCVWIGRFQQALIDWSGTDARLVKRVEVKTHHCMDSRAKDANITQALIDRFAKGQPNRGKGTKAEPGWFHGFALDIWQAYALAVLEADRLNQGTLLEKSSDNAR